MRLQSGQAIWILHGGKQYPGHFNGYAGRGMAKTTSDLGLGKLVPRGAVKARNKAAQLRIERDAKSRGISAEDYAAFLAGARR